MLGQRLAGHRGTHAAVLGLARGGVPVALEVARAIDGDLDVLVVRKVGAPANPEYGIGAVAEGGAVFFRPGALAEVGLTREQGAALARREAGEVARRVRAYRGGRPLTSLAGRTAIIVDDGVATGATARAAARAARRAGASRVVLAAPVIAAASAPEMAEDFDEIVACDLPEPFYAVGQWYERFDQVSDDEVLACLGAPGADSPPVSPDENRTSGDELEADLAVPAGARALVLFAHGSGSSRRSPRNRAVAAALRQRGLGTMLVDLETAAERERGGPGLDVGRLGDRVAAVVRQVSREPATRGLPVFCLGASTGAAVALAAAARPGDRIAGVISRGGRPDLLPPEILRRVHVPVLLVVGSRDEEVLELNRAAMRHLPGADLEVVDGATHLFEEPGTLDEVGRLAGDWIERHLPGGAASADDQDRPRRLS
jgi:putative phosphoribosyl transferase